MVFDDHLITTLFRRFFSFSFFQGMHFLDRWVACERAGAGKTLRIFGATGDRVLRHDKDGGSNESPCVRLHQSRRSGYAQRERIFEVRW